VNTQKARAKPARARGAHRELVQARLGEHGHRRQRDPVHVVVEPRERARARGGRARAQPLCPLAAPPCSLVAPARVRS
jgi:hypothetical protein